MASIAIASAVSIGSSLLLNFLFRPKGEDVVQEGPRLSDLTVTSSSYGQAINDAFGVFRMSGNVIWSPGIQEIPNISTQSSGGKGGGGGGSVKTTTYQYFASFQTAFCEGEAVDILQIFADGKLIFDRITTNPTFAVPGLKFRFYPGDEEQLPDPLIEVDKGVGNVPGHRGLCHLVFELLPLVNFGNRIPVITAVIAFKTSTSLPFQSYTLLSGSDIPGSVSGTDLDSHMMIDFASDALYTLKVTNGGLTRSGVNNLTMQAFRDGGALSSNPYVFGLNQFIYGQFGATNVQAVQKVDPVTMNILYSLTTSGIFYTQQPGEIVNGSFLGVKVIDFSDFGLAPLSVLVASIDGAVGSGGVQLLEDVGEFPAVHLLSDYTIDIGRGGVVIQDQIGGRVFFLQESNTISELYEVEGDLNFGLMGQPEIVPFIRKVGTYTKGGTHLPGTADITGWCVLPNESALILSNASGMIKVGMDAGTVLAQNLTEGFQSKHNLTTTNLFAYPDVINSTEGQFVTIQVDDLSVVRKEPISTLIPGFIENTIYPRGVYDYRNHSVVASRVNGQVIGQDPFVRVFLHRASGESTGLDGIVLDIAEKVGLEFADMDVMALSGTQVDGYVLTRQATARNSLIPLQQAFLFDLVESDFKVKAVVRGGTPITIIEEDEVGRLRADSKEDFVKETRTQEVELPRRLFVNHADKARDYQNSTQFDQRVTTNALTTRSDLEQTIELPIAMLPTTGKQLAQRSLYTVWAERLSLGSELPWKFLALDPTDVFTLNYRGEARRLRLSQVELGADFSLEFRSTQEDSRSNDSSVQAEFDFGFIPQFIPSALPTKFLGLDVPLLADTDASYQNFVRAYFAVAGFDSANPYPGGLLFQSLDNGRTFTEVASAPLESAWGTVDGTIPDPITTATWDYTTVIRLKVARGIDQFSSSTESEVLNGANAIAVMGASGPEIIQFVTVTQIDVSTVDISQLLRGRRGTEDTARDHVPCEQWVLLEFGRTYTLSLALALRNVSLPYKGVTINTFLEDATSVPFTYTGQDLIPYSVSHIVGTRSTDLLSLVWVRRTRFNGKIVGIAPLNETIYEYDIDWFTLTEPTSLLFTIAVSQVDAFALTKANFEASTPATNKLQINQIQVINWNFEQSGTTSSVPGWIGDINMGGNPAHGWGTRVSMTNLTGPPTDPLPGQNNQFAGILATPNDTQNATMTQTQHLVNDLGFDPFALDLGPAINLDAWLGSEDAGDSVEVKLEVLNAVGGVIQTLTTGAQTQAAGVWGNFTASGTLATGARQLRLSCIADRVGSTPSDFPQGGVDQIRVTLDAATVFSPFQVKIYQKSEIVGRGRATLTQV